MLRRQLVPLTKTKQFSSFKFVDQFCPQELCRIIVGTEYLLYTVHICHVHFIIIHLAIFVYLYDFATTNCFNLAFMLQDFKKCVQHSSTIKTPHSKPMNILIDRLRATTTSHQVWRARLFSQNGPSAWNRLPEPEDIRAEPDITNFRKLLKTHY